ncbi:MAG: ribosome small subunit-dependent GTPase A [Planctomycetales bacterium]|nr:ribosome small subunit-dependent GTPase A [Planctomycetales bacterium]
MLSPHPGSPGPRRKRPSREKDWQRRSREERDESAATRAAPRGAKEEAIAPPDLSRLPRGTVLMLMKGVCQVRSDEGRTLRCVIRRTLLPPDPGTDPPAVVGDSVRFTEDAPGDGAIEGVEPRKSRLFRVHPQDEGKPLPRLQVLAANVDQVAIVASLREPDLRPGLVDRYLVGAAVSEIPSLLVLNKADLAPDPGPEEAAWRALGIPILRTSALEGTGIAELRAQLAGRRTVLGGHSGVGKSSLMAALDPDLEVIVSDVNPITGKGRHTTSSAHLLRLAGGMEVVDTPGIREFALAGLDADDVGLYFPDIAALAPGCHFTPCTHLHEPQCAVRGAVESGQVARFRFESYEKIRKSLE